MSTRPPLPNSPTTEFLSVLNRNGLGASIQVCEDRQGKDQANQVHTSRITLHINSGAQAILINEAQPGELHRFLACRSVELLDVLSVINDGQLEPLLVTSSGEGRVWLLMVIRLSEGKWTGLVAECSRPTEIDTSYTLMNTGEQKRYLDNVYDAFTSWLPGDFPLLTNSVTSGILATRVDPQELWFLKFPISAFSCSALYSFRQYRSVEFIVTGKSFCQYDREGRQIKAQLRDAKTLLSNTVVIINTYERQNTVERAARGTNVLIELLSLFSDISFDTEKLNLRWYVNPAVETISSILKDRTVAFVFADFEAGQGVWEVGRGMRRSWDDPDHHESSPGVQYFDLADQKIDLTHIRLMRVYHCNSAFMQSAARYDNRNPADARSIVSRLLSAGAKRVEGGLTQEDYFEFIGSVIELLLTPQLRLILELRCWQEGKSFNDLVLCLQEFHSGLS